MALPANLAYSDIIDETWVDSVVDEFTAGPTRYSALAGTSSFQKTGKTGFVRIQAAGDNGIDSVDSQADATHGQMILVVSRAEATDPGTGGSPYFTIAPYTYGMSIGYGGQIEMSSTQFSVRGNIDTNGNPGQFQIRNQLDTGCIFMTCYVDAAWPAGSNTFGLIEMMHDTTGSQGPLRLQVYAVTDAVEVWQGAHQAGTKMVSLGALGPANEPGVKFGSAGDASLYRAAAGVVATPGELTAFALPIWTFELLLFHPPAAQTGAGWGVAPDVSMLLLNGYLSNAIITPAQNDRADFDIPPIPPGTWTIDLLGFKRPSNGIVTVQISDGAGVFTTVGTADFYNATDAYNSAVSVSGTVGAAAGPRRQLRFLMATKNASSSGYRAYLSHIRAWRTA